VSQSIQKKKDRFHWKRSIIVWEETAISRGKRGRSYLFSGGRSTSRGGKDCLGGGERAKSLTREKAPHWIGRLHRFGNRLGKELGNEKREGKDYLLALKKNTPPITFSF